ncbi:ATP-dependent helicase [Staphylococcus pseudintermedius]|uniref:UvrD-helicase domain-containing protein n=5 Tax=Staphylococcus pseudintermedius TaxID=283734 RepID=UPI000D7284EA|nr:ATP-dependent helicase [Staphylococcus pseudintermedius]EGQ3751595.1 AAA family ATPase [Staphylococcus pseudintermedius]EGQ3835829.1 ATP-dependent helicase [Staphylococcus pseudintermedius]EGQ4134366.1 ATP-dependent helicase [Staphylococcus pseudintermedius]EGQ4284526.1 ATP-dependent helicase [Staphylococcus pseudintermedius]EII2160670.1 ATP-dependent helicase [Staphylococcus pseudintermedius]
MKKVTKPTDEQIKIIRENGNLVITAKPGSGKTYTIVEKIIDISKNLLSYQGVIAISFTRKASQELELRYKRKNIENTNHFFGTIDKFYISEIIVPFSKLLFDKGEPLEVKDSIDDYPKYKDLKKMKENRTDKELLGLLKESLQEGLIFLEISGETALFILNEVPQCVIYLKARYTHIFIDEYQDCGEIQHEIFLKLVNKEIIGIAVGDLDQAIYAFSNRYSKYLLSLIGDDSFTHLEITRNHRCHKSISDYSLELMGITREDIDEDKRVFKVNVRGTDEQIIYAIENNLDEIKRKFNINKNSDFAILCRGNGTARRASKFLTIDNKLFVDTPLDKINGNWASVFNDILNSYYVYKCNEITVLDFVSKYINEELHYKNFRKALELVDKVFNLDDNQLERNLNEFIKVARLIYPDQEDERTVQILKRILKNEEELYSFKPATENEINIMTLHKSKGLEFKCVFLMDLYKWILPFEGDWVSEEDYIQALNLHYVGITRAIEACYIMQGTKRYNESSKKYFDAIESPFLYRHNTSSLREEFNW